MKSPEKLNNELSYIRSLPWKEAVSFVMAIMNWNYERARGFVLDVKQNFM